MAWLKMNWARTFQAEKGRHKSVSSTVITMPTWNGECGPRSGYRAMRVIFESGKMTSTLAPRHRMPLCKSRALRSARASGSRMQPHQSHLRERGPLITRAPGGERREERLGQQCAR